jgi:DNA polymerase-3 subunit epsilon
MLPMKDRIIAMDTETTGLTHSDGDRVIEIGCVEIVGNMLTGNYFHMYVNPGRRKVHPEAYAVHKISDEDLLDKPPMSAVMPKFIEFIGDSPMVIHNAPFDMGFINAELKLLKMKELPNQIIDSLTIARKQYPNARNSLDALCGRFGIDTSKRVAHGAHIDAELLANVYIHMLGLNQLNLGDKSAESQTMNMTVSALVSNSLDRPVRPARPALMPNEVELAAHAGFLAKKIKSPIWAKIS